MLPIDPLQSQASSSAMTKSSSNQKSLGQTLIYLLAWRLRLALIWLHGQTKSIIGDDEMETWSICFVAELVSTPCYISTITVPKEPFLITGSKYRALETHNMLG